MENNKNNDVKLWLFVNKDGTEMMSNERPRRIVDWINEHMPVEKKYKSIMTRAEALAHAEKYCDTWYTSVSDSDYGMFNGTDLDLWNDIIELPPGFIKHLTGKTITSDDEPIEFIMPN